MPLPFTKLYGKTSANLYSKAFSQHMQAKKAFETAADTYFMANDAASYDDWKRARSHWNYFCELSTLHLLVGALFHSTIVELHARFSYALQCCKAFTTFLTHIVQHYFSATLACLCCFVLVLTDASRLCLKLTPSCR